MKEFIIKTLKAGNLSTAKKRLIEELIDSTTDDTKRYIIKHIGKAEAPRNLYYNFNTQKWLIDA